MEISRKSGIKTVKHTKVNEELYELISQESANFAGGIEEFQREAFASYFENSTKEPVIISLIPHGDCADRITSLPNAVSIDTKMFFVNLMNETGENLEIIVGELLTKFVQNPANIPTIIRNPVILEDPVILPEPVAAQPEAIKTEFDSLAFQQEPVKPANIIEINLNELVLESVIDDLKRFGFDESKYLSLEAEHSAHVLFDNMMNERIAAKDILIENLRNTANPSEEMKIGFKGLLDFAIILYKAHLDRNGPGGILTKISREHMVELCPVELKQFFL